MTMGGRSYAINRRQGLTIAAGPQRCRPYGSIPVSETPGVRWPERLGQLGARTGQHLLRQR